MDDSLSEPSSGEAIVLYSLDFLPGWSIPEEAARTPRPLAAEGPLHASRTLQISHPTVSEFTHRVWERVFVEFGPLRDLYFPPEGDVVVSYYDIRHAKACYRCFASSQLCPSADHRPEPFITRFVIPSRTTPAGDDLSHQGTLVVFNLDPMTSVEELRSVFELCGEVKEIRETPQKRHHKFVEFYDVRHATAAMNTLNKTEIGGKRIKIEASRPGGARRCMVVGGQGDISSSLPPRRSSLASPPKAPRSAKPFVPGTSALATSCIAEVSSVSAHAASGSAPPESALTAPRERVGLPTTTTTTTSMGLGPTFGATAPASGLMGLNFPPIGSMDPAGGAGSGDVSPLTAAIALSAPAFENTFMDSFFASSMGGVSALQSPQEFLSTPAPPSLLNPGTTTVMIDAPGGYSAVQIARILVNSGRICDADVVAAVGAAGGQAESFPAFINFRSELGAKNFVQITSSLSWGSLIPGFSGLMLAPRPAPVQGAVILRTLYPGPLACDPREISFVDATSPTAASAHHGFSLDAEPHSCFDAHLNW